MGQLAKLVLRLTHRIVYKQVMVHDLYAAWRFVPQWWFLWWHCYWQQIGYDYYIPESFETLKDAQAFLAERGIVDYKELYRGMHKAQ